ncbi:hypothetical protein ACIRD9_22120 [Streptomyces violaceus]|uniref:hypothetical protein n=1 Tax=Streptomyces violaceus TaxID=1936 RepID=UPI00380813EC
MGGLPTKLYTRRERLAGYRSARRQRPRPARCRGRDRPTPRTGRSPTALFAGNNIMALGIVAELARGKRKDVAVVAQDPEELGRTPRPPPWPASTATAPGRTPSPFPPG